MDLIEEIKLVREARTIGPPLLDRFLDLLEQHALDLKLARRALEDITIEGEDEDMDYQTCIYHSGEEMYSIATDALSKLKIKQ